MQRVLVVIALITLAASGCASNAGATRSTPGAPTVSPSASTAASSVASFAPHPHETTGPCQYPSTTDLLNLEYDSTLVVEATIPVATATSSQVGTLNGQAVTVPVTPITDVKVIARRPGVPSTVTPSTVTGGWASYLPVGQYLIFLGGAGSNTPTSGMSGFFRISDGSLYLQCSSADDLTMPVAAAGTPPSLATFAQSIPSSLPTLKESSPTASGPVAVTG